MASAVVRLGSNWVVSVTVPVPDNSRLRVIFEYVLCIWRDSRGRGVGGYRYSRVE